MVQNLVCLVAKGVLSGSEWLRDLLAGMKIQVYLNDCHASTLAAALVGHVKALLDECLQGENSIQELLLKQAW